MIETMNDLFDALMKIVIVFFFFLGISFFRVTYCKNYF